MHLTAKLKGQPLKNIKFEQNWIAFLIDFLKNFIEFYLKNILSQTPRSKFKKQFYVYFNDLQNLMNYVRPQLFPKLQDLVILFIFYSKKFTNRFYE